MRVALLLSSMLLLAAGASECELQDGDCPTCPLDATLSPTAILPLSAVEPGLVRAATSADAVIRSLGTASDIISFDDPPTGLHTSIFYLCCHTLSERALIRTALERMIWDSFEVKYDGFGRA